MFCQLANIIEKQVASVNCFGMSKNTTTSLPKFLFLKIPEKFKDLAADYLISHCYIALASSLDSVSEIRALLCRVGADSSHTMEVACENDPSKSVKRPKFLTSTELCL